MDQSIPLEKMRFEYLLEKGAIRNWDGNSQWSVVSGQWRSDWGSEGRHKGEECEGRSE